MANGADPDNAVSDQDLYCLLTKYSIKISNEEIPSNTPKSSYLLGYI